MKTIVSGGQPPSLGFFPVLEKPWKRGCMEDNSHCSFSSVSVEQTLFLSLRDYECGTTEQTGHARFTINTYENIFDLLLVCPYLYHSGMCLRPAYTQTPQLFE